MQICKGNNILEGFEMKVATNDAALSKEEHKWIEEHLTQIRIAFPEYGRVSSKEVDRLTICDLLQRILKNYLGLQVRKQSKKVKVKQVQSHREYKYTICNLDEMVELLIYSSESYSFSKNTKEALREYCVSSTSLTKWHPLRKMKQTNLDELGKGLKPECMFVDDSCQGNSIQ